MTQTNEKRVYSKDQPTEQEASCLIMMYLEYKTWMPMDLWTKFDQKVSF